MMSGRCTGFSRFNVRLTRRFRAGNGQKPLCFTDLRYTPDALRDHARLDLPRSRYTSARRSFVARTDIIVLGAGIVGTSIARASRQARRRGGAGRPRRAGRGHVLRQYRHHRRQHDLSAGVSVELRRRSCASRSSARRRPIITCRFCRKSRRGSLAFRAASQPARLVETAQIDAAAVWRARSPSTRRSPPKPAPSAISAVPAGSSSTAPTGRSRRRRASSSSPRSFGIANVPLDRDAARALEPSLAPVFRHAVHWTGAVSVTNPLAVTRAYAARFAALGGLSFTGDARTLHRADGRLAGRYRGRPARCRRCRWSRSGPWAPDVLDPLGIRLPLAVKRGYHWHFRPQGNAGLSRPVLDAENGYVLAPMEQGIRLTTGAEFAAPRRPADAGAVRPGDAGGARIVSARRSASRRSRGWARGRALPIPGR